MTDLDNKELIDFARKATGDIDSDNRVLIPQFLAGVKVWDRSLIATGALVALLIIIAGAAMVESAVKSDEPERTILISLGTGLELIGMSFAAIQLAWGLLEKRYTERKARYFAELDSLNREYERLRSLVNEMYTLLQEGDVHTAQQHRQEILYQLLNLSRRRDSFLRNNNKKDNSNRYRLI